MSNKFRAVDTTTMLSFCSFLVAILEYVSGLKLFDPAPVQLAPLWLVPRRTNLGDFALRKFRCSFAFLQHSKNINLKANINTLLYFQTPYGPADLSHSLGDGFDIVEKNFQDPEVHFRYLCGQSCKVWSKSGKIGQ